MADQARLLPESYWVLFGKLLAGENPVRFDVELTRRRLHALLEAGFDTFIDLTESDELPTYLALLNMEAEAAYRRVDYHRFPVLDRGLPARAEMIAILDALDEAIADGHKVYLHCWGGVGRTGTVVGCYLVRHGRTGQQAVDQLAAWWQDVPKRRYFPRSPETDEQVKFILDWHESPKPVGRSRSAFLK
jgi:hypothetical protein